MCVGTDSSRMGVAMKSVSRGAAGCGPGGVAAAWGRGCPLTSACVSSPSVPANESSEVESWRECSAEESIELLCREWVGARVEPAVGSREGVPGEGKTLSWRGLEGGTTGHLAPAHLYLCTDLYAQLTT